VNNTETKKSSIIK